MKRFSEAASGFLTVAGVILLMVSVMLVPQGRAFADDGEENGQKAKKCVKNSVCDQASHCFVEQPLCVPPSTVDWCDKIANPTDCADCRCLYLTTECQCKP